MGAMHNPIVTDALALLDEHGTAAIQQAALKQMWALADSDGALAAHWGAVRRALQDDERAKLSLAA